MYTYVYILYAFVRFGCDLVRLLIGDLIVVNLEMEYGEYMHIHTRHIYMRVYIYTHMYMYVYILCVHRTWMRIWVSWLVCDWKKCDLVKL